jgi:uncharacterized protein YjbI with pentapeptide repeats
MTTSPRIALFCCLASLLTAAAFAQDALTIGANVNMVSGGSFPDGDPFQRQQNEPSVAFSSRNSLHLIAGANDYRAVDVPGLPGGRETGDSWLSYFWSTNGGATWKSTLIPGYPQDPACQSANAPTLCGYAAGADPVVRAGVNGMFYYSGIVFERADPSRSAIFVSRFIDLNNDEGGDPIRYLDTVIIDANNDGAVFLDKSWIGVDVPRGSVTDTFAVTQRDGSTVDQTVACGNVYVGYAAIAGEGDNLRSEIRLATSDDCGNGWDIQTISQPDSLNQGANIAIRPDTGELHVAWRRFDTVESFLGISPTGCPASPESWKINSDWPVSTITMGGTTYTIAQAQALLGTKHRGDESIKLAYEVIAAKLNLLTGGGDLVPGFNAWEWSQNLTNLIADAEAWFAENPIGSDPKQQSKKAGQDIKKSIQSILQGSGSCADSGTDETLTVTGETNAIMVASSLDFGETFSAPVVIDESSTFDQGSTRFTFRTTAYPTIAADADGRIYVAWAARGFAAIRGEPSDGDARIVVSTSTTGLSWTAPYAIDEPNRKGHQIKPSLLFAGGQLTLVYYDFRQDVSNIFEGFVIDLPEADRLRHTVDVRVATALPAAAPVFTDYSLTSSNEPVDPSDPASRYSFIAYGDESGGETLQVEYMVPNFPMFADGTTPFIGDYVDIAAPNLINDGGTWRFASNPGDVQVWQAVWSDNRDVVPPPDGDWSKYVAPIRDAQPSLFDPTVTIPSCFDVSFPASDFPEGSLYTGTRNQNVYSASISNGIIVAAPGNNRPLGGFDGSGAPLKRGFVIYVQNTTAQAREFSLSLPTTLSGIEVSFAPSQIVTQTDIEIPPYSSAVATVFASGAANTAIPVSVAENGGTLTGSVYLNNDPAAPGPLETSLLATEVHNPAILNPAVLNPAILNASVSGDDYIACAFGDPTKPCVLTPAVLNPAVLNPAVLNPAVFNPAVLNPAILNPAVLNPAVFNPAVFNPAVMNPAVMNPAVLNPAILNPAVFNPAVFNPAVLNPAVLNPAVLNPAVLNPAILNPAVLNPAVLNPAVFNPAILNPAVLNSSPTGDPQQVDVTFAIRNDGNATTAYDLNLAAPQLAGLDYSVVVYRLNETPVAQGCELVTEAQQQLIFNQTDPLSKSTDGSFYLEPGQQVLVTFRVQTDPEAETPADPVSTFVSNDVYGVVSAQPPNTDPVTQPLPVDQFGPPASCEIAGDWSGTYFQPGFSPYPMLLTNIECGTPGSVIANVAYPSLGCSGTWTLDAIVGSSLLVTETVSGGSCVPVVEHELLGLDGGTLSGITPAYSSSFSLTRPGASTFTETVITGDADILNDGVLIVANDLGVAPSAVTVNGVSFGTDQGGLSGPWGPGSGDFSLDSFSGNLDALLSDLQFSGTLNPVSLTIGGLTPGVAYRLQLLFSNDLNTTGDRVEVTVEGETWILDDWQPNAINLSAQFIASGPSVEVTFAPGVGSTGESGRAVLNAYAIHLATGPGLLVSADDPVFGAGSITLDLATGLEWLDLGFSINRSFDDVSANFGPGGDFEGFRYATAAELITLYMNAGIVNIDTNVLEAVNLTPVSNLLNLTGTTWSGTGSGPFAGGRVSDVHPSGGRRVSFYQVDNAGTGGRANILTSGSSPDDAASPVDASHLVRATGQTITSVSPDPGGAGDGFIVLRGTNFPVPASGIAEVTNGVTTDYGFIFLAPSTTSTYYVRLPAGFPAGPATIQILGGASPTNAFPITVSTVPGVPIITNVFSPTTQLPISTVTAGGRIQVAADGIDTLGWQIRFYQGVNSWTVTPDAMNFAVSNSVVGLALEVDVPAALTTGAFDVTVEQSGSGESTPVTLSVP